MPKAQIFFRFSRQTNRLKHRELMILIVIPMYVDTQKEVPLVERLLESKVDLPKCRRTLEQKQTVYAKSTHLFIYLYTQ